MDFHFLKLLFYNSLYKLNLSISDSNEYKNPVVISGTTRGGTTWLMEMLCQKQMQIVWEPTKYESLTKIKGEQFAKQLGVIPYIPENEVWDEAHDFFSTLFNGGFPQSINKESHPLMLSNPFNKNRLLIKLCNINLLLPWLCNHFDISPILIVRNPYSVIASQKLHSGYREIGNSINLFKINNPRFGDVFENYKKPIESINSQVGMLANWWAIQNAPILNHPSNNVLWKMVFYEELLKDSILEMNSLLKAYKIDKEVENVDLSRVGATSLSSTLKSRKEYEFGWQQVLSKEEVKDISNVLNLYGLDQFIQELP